MKNSKNSPLVIRPYFALLFLGIIFFSILIATGIALLFSEEDLVVGIIFLSCSPLTGILFGIGLGYKIIVFKEHFTYRRLFQKTIEIKFNEVLLISFGMQVKFFYVGKLLMNTTPYRNRHFIELVNNIFNYQTEHGGPAFIEQEKSDYVIN